MFGELIEEMINLFKSNGSPLDPHSIAMDVVDSACAHGLLDPNDDAAIDLAVMQIEAEVPYYFTATEFKKWEKDEAKKGKAPADRRR